MGPTQARQARAWARRRPRLLGRTHLDDRVRGGATAEGQLSVLNSLGVTEEAVGCPIHSSMDTAQIGQTPEGIPVLIDQIASQDGQIGLLFPQRYPGQGL